MSTGSEHMTRIEQFKLDLLALKSSEVTRKHITTGAPALLTESEYYDLRSLVAIQFDVHPSEVILVGSCRLGFSISPKKRFREARPNSDLDLAIISSTRFDDYWDGVFAYAASDRAWKQSSEYKTFVRMLFNGWIDPRGLPTVPRFEQAEIWTRFFDELMRTRRFGIRRISTRLYRTWMRLEAYQEQTVVQCKATIGDSDA